MEIALTGMLQIGHLVRRTGAQADTKNTGVIVETTSPADPELAAVLPAQLKVYWRVTGLIEELLSTDVEGAYPGGNAYRAWDGDFPLFAVETGGFGDITVVTPDGETAITVTEEDMATGAREYTLDPDSDQPWKHQVLTAVERYLDKTAPDGAWVASSLPRSTRDESCIALGDKVKAPRVEEPGCVEVDLVGRPVVRSESTVKK